MANDSDSDELFPLEFQSTFVGFTYDDPLLLSGILRAVVEEDLSKVEQLISEGKSVNINDNNGNTPLHIAALKNLPNIVDYLLTVEDIQIDNRNFYGETPLLQAVKKGHLHVVEKLIKAHCDVNIPNSEDISPLHGAVKYPEIVHLLIENGANIDAIDYSGESPLHEAITEKCLETSCMLLYYNADANIRADNNLTPFMKAIILEFIEVQEILLDYVTDFNVATEEGMTVLNLALTHECPYVEEIIQSGADINNENAFLNTFVMCVKVPNVKNFELIWKDFKYQSLIENIPYFDFLVGIDDNYYIFEYLRIIIKSGNVDPFFEQFSLTSYLNFINNTSLSVLDLTTEIVCIYLSYGNILECSSIDLIYQMYGHCELLEMCLHMSIEMIRDNQTFNLSRLLYDMQLTIDDYKKAIIKEVNNPLSLSKLLPYFRLGKFLTLPRELEVNETDFRIFCRLPSLLELARNKTRDYIINRNKLFTPSQYYVYLRFLDIPKVYKDIITFRKPIYMVQ